MAFTENRKNGVVYMTSSVIGTAHAFSTRLGGVSGGCFSSLNLSYSSGDEASLVTENYRRLGSALGIDVFAAAFTKQEHGVHVRVIENEDRASPTDKAPCPSDGLVTRVENLPLFCFTADCVPVLLYDYVNRVAGAVHCGWRSSTADILGVAVGKMISLGAKPEHMHAAIGPAIGVCCFETDSDVPDAVTAYLGGGTDGVIFPGDRAGKYYVNLREANRRRLLSLGLREDGIDLSAECTRCLPGKYWSHRAVGGSPRGVQCAVISIDGRREHET